MNKLWKKLSALALAAAVTATSIVLPAAYSATMQIGFDSSSDTTYTLDGAAVLADGREGSAVSLDGNGSYVTVDGDLSGVSSPYSISVWIKPNDTAMWTRAYDFGTGEDKYVFLAPSSSFGDGLPRFVVKNGGAEQVLMSDTRLNVGEWNNIVVTYDGTTTVMYLNGFNVGQTTDITIKPSDIGPTTNNWLGRSQYAADPYFNGMIDGFAVYDSALGEEEVREVAAEAYTDAVMEYAAKDDKYIISVDFYDTDTEEKIFYAESGQTVTAVVHIRNHTTGSSSLTASVVSGQSQQTAIEAAQEQVLYLETEASGESVEISVTDNATGQVFQTATLPVGSAVVFPENVPLDEDDTVYPEGTLTTETYGAHDPTIFKDPVGGKYWAYSSHNLVFESEDLINWTKHDYTQTITVPPEAKAFIERNYSGTTVNETYWAPDVLYVEGDEYPYWFYLSVSCGLGGRNSVISLVKAKSPGLWDGEYQDCGVVLASKENNNYKTNAIDANIYTDADGSVYFIWGSFWRGLQIAPLKADGFIEGIDYTSDATILSSGQNFGTDIFSVPNGVYGPEGPFTIDNSDEGYRYMFVSYGWLGTNYNIRVARMPLSTPMSSAGSTSFVDDNGETVGNAYSGQSDKSYLRGYKMIGSYQLGDGITYYGNGHNSILHDGDDWYLVEHCRKVPDAVAYLQVRRILWTDEGWPVVSPVVYSGEDVQTIDDEALLWGTWDLSSVGETVTADNFQNVTTGGDLLADLPVLSSEVVLEPDGTIGGDLGTWDFDGEYTVTLNFTADGDEENYEFYDNGTEMTLYVMAAYDKDKDEKALVMTGVDNENTAQFAKKSNASYADTTPTPYDVDMITLDKSEGGNPILGFDQNGDILYGGDPAATVIGDTVYLYVGHDTAENESYVMPNYVLYTSKDMVNWEYKGVVMEASSVSWASNTTSAWASQMVEHDGKYYLYFCTWDKTDGGRQSIGVAVADSPEGPFVDIGQPLVKGSQTYPQVQNHDDIDPTVFIETVDGVEKRYLAWGNTQYYICELNEDMVSVVDKNADGVIDMNDIQKQKIDNLGSDSFTEGPWLYKRGDKYYTFFAEGWREQLAYAVSDEGFYGPWSYGGTIMQVTATSNTTHPSVIDFNGHTYMIYHNGSLPHGSGFRRVVCVEELFFDENGLVLPLTETATGLAGEMTTLVSADGKYLGHETVVNPHAEVYPLTLRVTASAEENGYDTAWEIVAAKDGSSENYVSIESVNKPGLYLADVGGELVLTQDADGQMGQRMTFKTVEGIAGEGVSFESVSTPGKYITLSGNNAYLTYGRDPESATFVQQATSPTPAPTAAPLPTATPVPPLTDDVDNNFDSLQQGTLIYVSNVDQEPYAIDGAQLYVGTRSGGADSSTNWAVETGGISGNALVMNSGRFASGNRSPKLLVNTPTLIEGATVTMKIQVKPQDEKAELYFWDSTATIDTAQATKAELKIGEWNEVAVTITNDGGVIARTVTVNGAGVQTDAVATFPAIWGTSNGETYTKLFFDNLEVTTDVSAGAAGEVSVSGSEITVTVETGTATVYAVSYDEAGILEDVEIFTAEDSETFTAGFEPDVVFLWTGTMAPLDMARQ